MGLKVIVHGHVGLTKAHIMKIGNGWSSYHLVASREQVVGLNHWDSALSPFYSIQCHSLLDCSAHVEVVVLLYFIISGNTPQSVPYKSPPVSHSVQVGNCGRLAMYR